MGVVCNFTIFNKVNKSKCRLIIKQAPVIFCNVIIFMTLPFECHGETVSAQNFLKIGIEDPSG